MPFNKLVRSVFLAALVAGGLPAALHAADDPLTQALAGKTLVSPNATIRLARNGALSGKVGQAKLSGAWTVRDGKFCRTLKAPENLAGTQCQDAQLNGKTVTLTTGRGPVVYQIK